MSVAAENLRSGEGPSVGYVVESAGPGFSRFRLDAGPQHCSRSGRIKGAVLYGLVENSMYASMKEVPRDQGFETLFLQDVELRFLRPIGAGRLFCETKVLHHDGNIAVLETNVVDDHGIISARASGCFRL